MGIFAFKGAARSFSSFFSPQIGPRAENARSKIAAQALRALSLHAQECSAGAIAASARFESQALVATEQVSLKAEPISAGRIEI